MTPEALARLHAAAFTMPRPWSAAEFRALLDSPGVFLAGDGEGFVLGRALAGEAELLTLAVHPAARRRGQGRRWLNAFEAEARARGAEEALLEVAADNAAALALYHSAGWREAGRRPRYYRPAQGPRIDALLLRKGLAGT